MRFFWLKTNPPSSKLRVRDLKPGMKVPIGTGTAEVMLVEMTSGFIGGNGAKSARALRVHFTDHDPVIAHPNDEVDHF